MSFMFSNCSSLKSIDLSSDNKKDILNKCYLKSLNLSSLNIKESTNLGNSFCKLNYLSKFYKF